MSNENSALMPITRVLYGPDHPSRRPGGGQKKERKEHFIRVHNYVSVDTLLKVAKAFPKSKTAQVLARRRRG